MRSCAGGLAATSFRPSRSALAYVQAQNEYAALNPAGLGRGVYAQRIVSHPGKKDGLYWPTAEGETPSPLGDLAAQASAEGYKVGGKPIPYHGYYYRILTRQGADAPGGAYDYLVKGKMIGGFALLAYPAEYGNSGIMTFMVSHDGTVFEKDLEGAKPAQKIDFSRPIKLGPRSTRPGNRDRRSAVRGDDLGRVLIEASAESHYRECPRFP